MSSKFHIKVPFIEKIMTNKKIKGYSSMIRSKSEMLFRNNKFLVCLTLLVILLILTTSLWGLINNPNHLGGNNLISPKKDAMEVKPKKVSIVVDAGHGGNDWGTYYSGIKEKTLNLDIALRLGKLLEEEGIKVIYTRETDVFVDLHKRPEIANNSDATLYISVHNNRMPGNTSYKGTETLYATDSNSEFSKMSDKKLADIVQSELTKDLGTVDAGVIRRPNLAVLHLTKMPAIIAEIGYISNTSDRKRLLSADFRQKAAKALYNSIIKALDEMDVYKDKTGEWMILPG